MNSDDTPKQLVSQNKSDSVSDISDNASNSDTYHHHIDTEPKSLKNREIERREKNREKKLQRGSTIQDVSSDLSDDKDIVPSGNRFECNDDLSQPDKNQIVEQDLKQELSASSTQKIYNYYLMVETNTI
ncbi:4655_t:CDS:2, partial [Acaulospora morrowiae]